MLLSEIIVGYCIVHLEKKVTDDSIFQISIEYEKKYNICLCAVDTVRTIILALP